LVLFFKKEQRFFLKKEAKTSIRLESHADPLAGQRGFAL
jgi:hypothetical protein